MSFATQAFPDSSVKRKHNAEKWLGNHNNLMICFCFIHDFILIIKSRI